MSGLTGLKGGGVVDVSGLSGSLGKEKWKLVPESLEDSENIAAGSVGFIGFLA